MNKFLTFAATVAVALTLLDRLLPSDRMDTTVQSSTLSKTSGAEIVYQVPLTGGGIASCTVSKNTVRKLPERSEVVVATSAIFSRCTGVYPLMEPQGINRAAFVEAAIRYAYPDFYANLGALRADYPGFTPRIRFWGNDRWYQPASWRRYSVQLPEALVILDTAGTAQAYRACGSVEGHCELVTPARAEKGFVGTAQHGGPTYAATEDFELAWPGQTSATLFQSGHCFSAYSDLATQENPTVRIGGGKATPIRSGYGFFLVVHMAEGSSVRRISKQRFIQTQSCSPEAKATM